MMGQQWQRTRYQLGSAKDIEVTYEANENSFPSDTQMHMA
jgi:hypothetical protein